MTTISVTVKISKNIRTKYIEYLEAMLTEAGHDNAADAAQRIYDLEKQLAEHHWTRFRNSWTPKRVTTKMTIDEVRALMGGIDYDAVATLSGVDHAGVHHR